MRCWTVNGLENGSCSNRSDAFLIGLPLTRSSGSLSSRAERSLTHDTVVGGLPDAVYTARRTTGDRKTMLSSSSIVISRVEAENMSV